MDGLATGVDDGRAGEAHGVDGGELALDRHGVRLDQDVAQAGDVVIGDALS
jgi:hypothetical protein